MELTAIPEGRFIVGGASPTIFYLPRRILSTGKVIGVNRWPDWFPCDYWLGLDTGLNWKKYHDDTDPRYTSLPKFLKTMECPKYMRRPNKDTETFVPKDAGIFFDKVPLGNPLPTKWNGQLKWASSSAIAAIHLAIILGATNVVLFGVDFIGGSRADGTNYSSDEFWNPHIDGINSLLREFQNHVKIYKTNPASPLDCPMLEGLV